MNKVLAHARIKVEIELEASSWGSDCSLQQIYDQAGREALDKLERLFQKERITVFKNSAKVTAVLIPEDK